MSIPCIIIPAIVGIISGILGYLIGRMAWNEKEGGKAAELKAELDACHSKNKHLHAKLDNLQGEVSVEKSEFTADLSNASSTVMTSSAPIVEKPKPTLEVTKKESKQKPIETKSSGFDAAAAKLAFGKKVNLDDLKLVEGIGPKIAELFIAAGIKTWKELSETSVAKAQSILKEAGERYSMHNPGTWPRQAKMMHDGKWAELKAWTEKLEGGKES